MALVMALLFPAADAAAQPTAGADSPLRRRRARIPGAFKQDTNVATALQVDSTSLRRSASA
jgi:uncharacterized protein YPO0396